MAKMYYDYSTSTSHMEQRGLLELGVMLLSPD